MRIWETKDWKALPEHLQSKGLFSLNHSGRIFLYQDEGMEDPVILNPEWPSLWAVVDVLEFHRDNSILPAMIPRGKEVV